MSIPDTPERDVVKEARDLLETHSIVAMRVDKPYKEIRPLIAALCDEVEALRSAAGNAVQLILLNQKQTAIEVLDRARKAKD